jgi:MFS-type transporter involved in bile tolerance (Atg22 family)
MTDLALKAGGYFLLLIAGMAGLFFSSIGCGMISDRLTGSANYGIAAWTVALVAGISVLMAVQP